MPNTRLKASQVIIIAICLLVAIGSAVALVFFMNKDKAPATAPGQTSPTGSSTTTEEDTPAASYLDLQYVIDNWQGSVGNNINVAIYDLDNKEFAGRTNATSSVNIASIYKLFVAYEGYLRIERGQWKGSEKILGSYSREDCLDLMLRESYSPCAEVIAKEIGYSELDEIYRAKGFSNTSIVNDTSTASDIVKLLQLYYGRVGLSTETWDTIKDTLLSQPPSDKEDICEPDLCSWRQGLPAGFNNAKVYNKVGWLYDKDDPDNEDEKAHWKIYNDAAIVEFSGLTKEDGTAALPRHYIVVVLTRGITPNQIVTFARNLEKYIITKDNIKV